MEVIEWVLTFLLLSILITLLMIYGKVSVSYDEDFTYEEKLEIKEYIGKEVIRQQLCGNVEKANHNEQLIIKWEIISGLADIDEE